MANKIRITNESLNNSFKKGNVYITNGYKSVTHDSGFYNGLNSDSKYTFYIKKDGYVEDGLILWVDPSNPTCYNPNHGLSTVNDLSGKENDGELINEASYSGFSNGVFSFDGTNDFIKIIHNDFPSYTALTVSSWFYKTGEGGTYECTLHKNSDDTYTIGQSDFWMGVSNTNYLVGTIGARYEGLGWDAGLTTSAVTLNTWYNVTVSWDGTTVKVYTNGDFNKQYSLSTSNTFDDTTPTRMGSSDDGTYYQFNGKIGLTYIYDRGLSESEVLKNYNYSKGLYGL